MGNKDDKPRCKKCDSEIIKEDYVCEACREESLIKQLEKLTKKLIRRMNQQERKR